MAKNNNTNPITKKEEVQGSKDEKIDQDFPGFPHSPSKEKTINPTTEEDKANANMKKKHETPASDDNDSVGSANAFEATEGGQTLREELDDDKDEKNKKNYY
jgi:hypothetical protein